MASCAYEPGVLLPPVEGGGAPVGFPARAGSSGRRCGDRSRSSPDVEACVSTRLGGDEGRKAQLFSPASRTVKQTAGQAGVDTELRDGAAIVAPVGRCCPKDWGTQAAVLASARRPEFGARYSLSRSAAGGGERKLAPRPEADLRLCAQLGRSANMAHSSEADIAI
jgi:hypothetical protein